MTWVAEHGNRQTGADLYRSCRPGRSRRKISAPSSLTEEGQRVKSSSRGETVAGLGAWRRRSQRKKFGVKGHKRRRRGYIARNSEN